MNSRKFIPIWVDHFQEIFGFNENDYRIVQHPHHQASSHQLSTETKNRASHIFDASRESKK